MSTSDEDWYWKQRELVPQDRLRQLHLTIAGAGAMGSLLAMALGKMGVGSLTIMDFDTIEAHNLSTSQWYPWRAIGQPKVAMLAELLQDFTQSQVCCRQTRFGLPLPVGPVILAVDTMPARAECWTIVKDNPRVSILFDTRISALSGLLYAVAPANSADQARYLATLHSEEEAYEDPCEASQLIATPFLMANRVIMAVVAYLKQEPIPFCQIVDGVMGQTIASKTVVGQETLS